MAAQALGHGTVDGTRTAPVLRAGVRPLAALAARGRTPVSQQNATTRTISDHKLALPEPNKLPGAPPGGSALRRRLLPIMALRVLVLLLAHCAARPAPPRSLTLSGGAKKKAIKHGPRQCIRRRRRVTH